MPGVRLPAIYVAMHIYLASIAIYTASEASFCVSLTR